MSTETDASSPNFLHKRKQNAQVLASQYTTTKRAGEILSVILYTIFVVLTVRNVYSQLTMDNAWIVLTATVVRYSVTMLIIG
jgi:hypothetical protein